MKSSREVENITGGTYVSNRCRPVPNWWMDHHSSSDLPRENCQSAPSSVCASRPVCVTLYSGFEWRSEPIGQASTVTVASVPISPSTCVSFAVVRSTRRSFLGRSGMSVPVTCQATLVVSTISSSLSTRYAMVEVPCACKGFLAVCCAAPVATRIIEAAQIARVMLFNDTAESGLDPIHFWTQIKELVFKLDPIESKMAGPWCGPRNLLRFGEYPHT